MTSPLGDELLKQDGLSAGAAQAAILEQMQRLQTQAEVRERFWFRMASTFWILAGLCVLIVSILGSTAVHSSVSVTAPAIKPGAPAVEAPNAPAPQAPVVVQQSGVVFHPVHSTFFTALTLLPCFVLAGLFSSAWLLLTRRQAGHATLQLTLAALTAEVRALARK